MDIIHILKPTYKKTYYLFGETKLFISFRNTNAIYECDILRFKTPNTKDEYIKSEICCSDNFFFAPPAVKIWLLDNCQC